jgi:hypothetical protein
MTMDNKLAKAWADEFGTLPVDAGDIMNNPRTRAAFATACQWPVEHISARVIGRHIKRLLGDAVAKVPTHPSKSQRWSLAP